VPTNGVTKLKLSGLLNLGSSYYIQVNDGATLEIFSDSNKSILGSNYYLIRLNGGTLKLHGGTIEGENTTQPVTGVYVVSGTFTMDSGEISVKAEGGAGVINQGTFTMEKGKITAEGDGAEGVINSTGNTSGTFEMNGDAGTCTISAKGLGAAGVDNEAGCTFIMKGGSVAATGDNSQSVNNNGMFTMGAGSEISGEFVGISNGNGTFTMNGGEISMPDDATIAVENSSTFNMTGGTISANDKQATGVKNQGTFNMTGGTISGFDNGVSNFTGGTFTMDKATSGSSTGTISGNYRGVSSNGSFTMKDGRINGNTEYGVYVSSGTFEMSGGAITGNKQYGVKQNAYNAMIQLSGKVDISGNTTADVNLFYSSGVITVGENFSCDKPIGVYVDNDNESLRGRVITRNFKKNTGAKDPSKFFVSKKEGLGLFWNKDKTEAMFDKSVTITFDANGGEGTMEPWTAPWGNRREALVPECEFTRRGHTFYAWMLKATDGNEIIPAGSDTFFDDDDDTVLYAVWKQNQVEVTEPEDQVYTGKAIEPKLTVTDKVTNEKLTEGTDYTVVYSNNVNVTDYAVATVTFKGDYKDCEEERSIFAITPKPLTVTADSLTKVQGEKDPELTYKADGLVDGDKLEGKLAREEGEKPGTYKITQGTLDNKNYRITFVEGTLTIKSKSEDKPEDKSADKPEDKPEDTGAGDIDTEVEKGEDVPEMKVGGLTDETAKDLATKEELDRVEKGEKLMVYLTATNIDDTVSKADKKLVTAAITAKDKGGKVAQYLDFSMYKKIGGDKPTQLTDLKGHAITITITVPKAFRAPAGVKRTFYVVRVHDGEAQIVGSGTGNSVKVSTDKFSTYALTYVDETEPEPEPEPTAKPKAKADYTLLGQLTVSGSGSKALKLTWTKVKEADGYDVYFTRCGKDFKLKASVAASASRCVRFTGLKKRESYKAYVRAWKKVNGKQVYIGKKSPELHAITGGYDKDHCNAKSVRLSRSKLTLKVGKGKAIRATVKGVKSKRKLLDHVRKVRWYSSNVNVATVDSNGKVKAVGKGACTIYAIANNGVRNSVKVKVK